MNSFLLVFAFFGLTLFGVYSPDQVNRILSIHHENSLIELIDGSFWRISDSNSKNILKWRDRDSLVIQPISFSLVSSARFCLFNLRTQTSINVELALGPQYRSASAMVIEKIEPFYSSVWLKDGKGERSQWSVEFEDALRLATWLEGSSVIVGVTPSGFYEWFGRSGTILIQVEQYPSYARVQRIK